ncbi:hypothetical protein SKAU_G00061830 [Synaphobranchus kaupii]|uniref:Uncharacterized protein n=1 Tax=Synaphobranchus kaupii TaxID=118154 RepID=A0A9Q1JAF6_SYNKA|nr:hypothetical protein SKAU_G00061830 [Synaphobranchus kaupii]
MLLLLLLTTPGFGLQTPKIIQAGPKAGILLRDDPGFLVADAQTITYQIYVSLDPLQVIQSLFSSSMSIANTVSYNTLKKSLDSLQRDLEHIREQIQQQQSALEDMRTTLEDTVLLVNLHSRLINSTITQVRIAYNMGAAVPLFVDVENMQVAFMVILPFIRPENIYQLKAIINVGAWNGSYLTTVITPPVVAYQEKFTQYLVPNLKLCKKAKDLHWLCPSKPFVKDASEVLCGLSEGTTLEKCRVTVTRGPTNETRVAITNGQWLINTPLSELTVSYTQHYSITKLPIEPRVSLITVPENSVILVGDTALYHLDHGTYQAEVETIDVFRGQELEITEELEELLAKKDMHTLQVTVKRQGITYDLPRRDRAENHMAGNSHAILSSASMALLALILVLLHALWLHRKIHALSLQVNQLPPRVVYQANAPDPVPSRVSFQPY